MQVSEQGAAVLGPGIAGWLIGLVGAPLAVAADAASYLGSAAFVSRIEGREPEPPRSGVRVQLRTQVGEGLRYVVRDSSLRAIAIAAGITNLFGRIVVIVMLIYLVRTVGYSPSAVGVVFAIGGVGFLLGAAL